MHADSVVGLLFEEGYGDPAREAAEGPGVWFHVPAREVRLICLLRENPTRYYAHWVRGRVQPCTGPGCGLCVAQVGRKMRYVFSVMDTRLLVAGLIEVSPATAAEIQEGCKEMQCGRGVSFALSHEGGVRNGLIRAKCLHKLMSRDNLVEGPDPSVILRKMWSMPERERLGVSEF